MKAKKRYQIIRVGLITISFSFIYIISFCQTTLILQPGPEDGIDAYINKVQPASGIRTSLIASRWTYHGETGTGRSLLKFNLNNIPQSAKVISATLVLYHDPNSGHEGHSTTGGENSGELCLIKSQWEECSVDWYNQPAFDPSQKIEIHASSSTEQNYNLNITAFIQDMINNNQNNFGFMIKLKDEVTLYRSLVFASSDNQNPHIRPKLEITYEENLNLKDGLVAYYPFNGNASDESGNGNDGIVFGATLTEDMCGNSNMAYEFDGVNDFINFGNILNSTFAGTGKKFSVSFNLYINSDWDARKILIVKNSDSNCDAQERQFSIQLAEDKKIQMVFTNTLFMSGLGFRVVKADIPIDADTWNTVTITYNDNNSNNNGLDRVSIYINNIKSNTFLSAIQGSLGHIQEGPAHLAFGNQVNSSGQTCGDYFFKGKIDEIRIYNKLLTEQEINALNIECGQSINLEEGLVAYYPFNGNANDESGNGNDGIINGATLADDMCGNANSAFIFDGVDDYILLPANSIHAKEITLNSGVVSFWYKSQDYIGDIICYYHAGNGEDGFGARYAYNYQYPDDKVLSSLGFIYGTSKGDNTTYTISNLNIGPVDQWHHVIFIWNKSKNRFYYDGILVGEREKDEMTNFYSEPYNFSIGVYSDLSQNYYKGQVDELRIYNRELNEKEIEALYNECITDSCESVDISVEISATQNYGYGNEPIVFFGYNLLSDLTLGSLVKGGTPPYELIWSTGESSSSIIVEPIENTIYTLTAIDANGCEKTDNILIEVEDVRCGEKLDKVIVCQIPPGNPDNAHEICVSYNAVPSHIAHGCKLGSCNPEMLKLTDFLISIKSDNYNKALFSIFPNPSCSNAFIEFASPEDTYITIEVFNITGDKIITLFEENVTADITYQIGLNKQNSGMYLIKMTQGDKIDTQKIIFK